MQVTFELRPAPPFRLDLTVWTLRRRPENEIDAWDGRVYRRIFFLGRTPVLTSVRQTGPIDKPRLAVTAISHEAVKGERAGLATVLERTLGLRIDLRAFYAMADKDAKIRGLAHRFMGFRPPRFPSLFEAIVKRYRLPATQPDGRNNFVESVRAHSYERLFRQRAAARVSFAGASRDNSP